MEVAAKLSKNAKMTLLYLAGLGPSPRLYANLSRAANERLEQLGLIKFSSNAWIDRKSSWTVTELGMETARQLVDEQKEKTT